MNNLNVFRYKGSDKTLYRTVNTSTGAGTKSGEMLLIYEDMTTGEFYHRTLEDFNTRMEQFSTKECP